VNFYPKYRNYYSLFNDRGEIKDILQAGNEMKEVLNMELKYTALKQLLTTALALSVGQLLLTYLPLGFNDLMEGYFRTLCVGYGLYLFFETAYARKHYVRNSMKVIIVLGFSFLLIAIEGWLEGKIAISGLLAVVSMACVLKVKSIAFVSKRLSEKFGKLWLGAEVMLFVLVGAAVDIRYTLEAGFAAILMIFAALLFRTVGVLLCTFKTRLSVKERLFCVIAYLPKATVQAAIGSVPLAAGLPCGKIILSVAVMAIIITAPLGALGMDATYKKLLSYAES